MVLFADLQDGIFELARTVDSDRLRRGVSALARLANAYGLPAVLTTAPGGGAPPQPIREITVVLGKLPLNTRNVTDALRDAVAGKAIRATGRTTLLIAGVATEVVVQHSALSAQALGYDVQVVIDACGGLASRTVNGGLNPRLFGCEQADLS
jgi:hypothetical protein